MHILSSVLALIAHHFKTGFGSSAVAVQGDSWLTQSNAITYRHNICPLYNCVWWSNSQSPKYLCNWVIKSSTSQTFLNHEKMNKKYFNCCGYQKWDLAKCTENHQQGHLCGHLVFHNPLLCRSESRSAPQLWGNFWGNMVQVGAWKPSGNISLEQNCVSSKLHHVVFQVKHILYFPYFVVCISGGACT